MNGPYQFLSRTGDGVCVVDREQRIVLWNEAARELLGFAPDEAVGRRCYEVLAGVDGSGCAVCRPQCVASHTARRGEPVAVRDVRVRTRDAGRVWLSVSTISLPASWHELSVLAHLFHPSGSCKKGEARHEAAPDRSVRQGTPGPAVDSGPTKPIDGLTARESDVLRLLSTGASTETICARLGIAITTTRAHVRNILFKLGVHDRLGAVTVGLRAGLIEIARDPESSPDPRP